MKFAKTSYVQWCLKTIVYVTSGIEYSEPLVPEVCENYPCALVGKAPARMRLLENKYPNSALPVVHCWDILQWTEPVF